MKKQLLFMLTSMNVGGVEKSLLSLLSVIPKEHYDITVLLLEKKGGFLKEIPDWVKVEEATWFKEIKPIIMQPPQQTISNYYLNKQLLRIPFFVGTYLISKQFNNRYFYYKEVLKTVPINVNEYDVAISYQGPTDIIDYYIAHKVRAKKKVSWVHFDVSKHMINVKLYKKLYVVFDQIFTVSTEARKKLIEKIPNVESKAEVFQNIIPTNVIREMSRRPTDFDEQYQGLKIVTVGRLSKEKGQDLAIKVLARLRQEEYEVRWYCIGEGRAKDEYQKLIEENQLTDDFILLGAKENPYPYMLKADLYVQPSRHEGYCLTLAEAKCLNKPIVTTDFIGAYEQIEDGFNGYIVCRCEVELYKKIKYLIDHEIERIKLSSNLLASSFVTVDDTEKIFQYIH